MLPTLSTIGAGKRGTTAPGAHLSSSTCRTVRDRGSRGGSGPGMGASNLTLVPLHE